MSPSFRFAATCPHRRLSPCLFCGQGLAKCKNTGDLYRFVLSDNPDGCGGCRRGAARSGGSGVYPWRDQQERGASGDNPRGAPEIAELLRLVLGWAWTYVIVAELIGSSSGIGHMIVNSQALLNTGQMIFGIIVIGCIGLLSDLLFKAVNRRLFVWSSL